MVFFDSEITEAHLRAESELCGYTTWWLPKQKKNNVAKDRELSV
jgi:hypothetical protein